MPTLTPEQELEIVKSEFSAAFDVMETVMDNLKAKGIPHNVFLSAFITWFCTGIPHMTRAADPEDQDGAWNTTFLLICAELAQCLQENGWSPQEPYIRLALASLNAAVRVETKKEIVP